MAYCENIYQEYGEWLDAAMLIQAVGEMVNAEWEQAPQMGGRALSCIQLCHSKNVSRPTTRERFIISNI